MKIDEYPNFFVLGEHTPVIYQLYSRLLNRPRDKLILEKVWEIYKSLNCEDEKKYMLRYIIPFFTNINYKVIDRLDILKIDITFI